MINNGRTDVQRLKENKLHKKVQTSEKKKCWET